MKIEKKDSTAFVKTFIDSLNIFLAAYKGNVGKDPYALLLGPREYTLLCMHLAEICIVQDAAAEGAKNLPLATEYLGIPVHCKFTEGCEVLIDPKKAASIMYERAKKYEGYGEEQTRIEGI